MSEHPWVSTWLPDGRGGGRLLPLWPETPAAGPSSLRGAATGASQPVTVSSASGRAVIEARPATLQE